MSVARIRRVVAQYLRGEEERKAVDFILAASPPSGTPVIGYLTTIPQGTDYFERLGLEARLRRIHIRWSVTLNSAAAGPSQLLRFLVILDTQPNQANIPIGGQAGVFFSAAPSTESPRQFTTTQRYWVLNDQVVTVSSGQGQRRYGEFSHSLNAISHYDQGTITGSVSTILTNALWIMYIGSDAANPPAFAGTARLWFSDP